MEREILKKEISFATEQEINYLLQNIVTSVKNDFDRWDMSLNEDELIDEFLILKKDIVYVIKSDIILNTNENFKFFDVFFISKLKIGNNFDICNRKFELKKGKIKDISQADLLFEV